LKNIDDIAFAQFDGRDVVLNRFVQEIIKAYEKSNQLRGKN